MVERACCESDAVKVVCGISYEIAVRVFVLGWFAWLDGSNRKEGFAMTRRAWVADSAVNVSTGQHKVPARNKQYSTDFRDWQG